MPARFALFDLGRVLLDWEPARLYDKIFDTEAKRDWFLENVCTMAWHTRHDAGETFAETRPDLIAKFPEYEAEIHAWSERWMEMFDGYIDGTPEIMDRLIARGVPLYALSNMSIETWPWMQHHFPYVLKFKHTVVSGAVKLVKPNADIYHHTLKMMADPAPDEVFFIDDSEKNIIAADKLGFRTHLFKGAAGLEQALVAEGLLTDS